MKNEAIGTATLKYSEDGTLTWAGFEPTMVAEADEFVAELKKIGTAKDEKAIKEQAQLVLSNWFSKVTEAELADREHYTITSEVVGCDKYHNGAVRTCRIQFSLTPVAR